MKTRMFFAAIAIAVAVSLSAQAPAVMPSSPPRVTDAAQLQLALNRLTVVGRALYIAAHPDDENTAMLAWLANDKGVRAGYLALTRGDGGQNLIGDEKGDLLGVIRTQELLAARRVDNAEQFFSRAIDFGYSKSPDETLRIWGRDRALADVVWVIRSFRPDVIITRFPTTGEGGHGHHTASAILAQEAFRAAGDPNRFPEQLKYVTTWQPRRLFWNRWTWAQLAPAPAGTPVVTIDLGGYSQLLGRSYTEVAAESRSMHKSQGFGSAERRGAMPNEFQFIEGDAPTGNELFSGVDLSWSRVKGGAKTGDLLGRASQEFDSSNPSKIIPLLVDALKSLDKIDSSDAWTKGVVAEKRAAIVDSIRMASGLWLEAIAETPTVTPGAALKVTTTAINRSDAPLTLTAVTVKRGLVEDGPVEDGLSSPSAFDPAQLSNNKPFTKELTVTIPATTPYSQPYWLAGDSRDGIYPVSDQTLIGRAENAPAALARFTFAAGDTKFDIDVPLLYRWTDRVKGEHYRALAVVPPMTAHIDQKTLVFPNREPRKVVVTVSSAAENGEGTLRLKVPKGWAVNPSFAAVKLAKNQNASFTFTITPPAAEAIGELHATIEAAGGSVDRDLVTISYPHIPLQLLFPHAVSKLVRADVATRGKSIGYIMGAGDEVADALEQLGYSVTMLSDDDIEKANLSRFDAIVIGVRAYNMRDAVKRNNARLMDYVSNGGTVVDQYNTADDTLATEIGPYPLKLSRDRVTDETAPVTFVNPASPLLNTPNRISAREFEGWIQERGIYFAGERDSRYRSVIASHDPGEADNAGGLVYAKHGKGVFIYTGYVFFRELPAGVPGAYRLFANLVSARGNEMADVR